MKTRIHRLFILIPSITWALSTIIATEAEHIHGIYCHHGANIWSSNDSPSQRYAPDRAVDIKHLELDVTPDFKNRRVSGKATFTFQPILKPILELRLDAHDLEILKVDSSYDIAAWENTDRALIVTFNKQIEPKTEAKLTVTYEAEPKKDSTFVRLKWVMILAIHTYGHKANQSRPDTGSHASTPPTNSLLQQ